MNITQSMIDNDTAVLTPKMVEDTGMTFEINVQFYQSFDEDGTMVIEAVDGFNVEEFTNQLVVKLMDNGLSNFNQTIFDLMWFIDDGDLEQLFRYSYDELTMHWPMHHDEVRFELDMKYWDEAHKRGFINDSKYSNVFNHYNGLLE
mgnify:CR=1 FL=1